MGFSGFRVILLMKGYWEKCKGRGLDRSSFFYRTSGSEVPDWQLMKFSSSRALGPGANNVFFLLFGVALISGAASPVQAGTPTGFEADEGPSLVVVLVVDQLRGDLLDRYSSTFSGGLKRLLDEGLVYTNALHDHAQTETSPGHATISTGTFPGRAGIPSNAWRVEEDGDLHVIYNVVDPEVAIVGVTGLPGSSPSVLRRNGLADWIRGGESGGKVVSVSGKDRAAILMAGKSKGEVYWFDSQVGRFVTSTYYKSREPSWLREFNSEGLKDYLADSVWVSTVPSDQAHLSAPDTAGFESDGVHSYFPHAFLDVIPDPNPEDIFFWFETTPMLDNATLDVALLAMDSEGLGQKQGRTDFLSISFSQTDRIGHQYGPLSREQMDNLLRLDRTLEVLFSVLDDKVGKENYILGFTSDHGTMSNPERLGGKGVRLTNAHQSELGQALSVAARRSGTNSDLSTAEAMVEAMSKLDFVGPAYTHAQLNGPVHGDSLAVLFQHSLSPGRMGGLLSQYEVEMWWKENTLSWALPHGTTHGSPFHYDRWVPLILLGPGIDPGVVETPVRPMDLAPTLAELAGIPYPDDLDGKPLLKGLAGG
jgi:predicted AlkP superfamily pyrophosphatase or phosphodiesterase